MYLFVLFMGFLGLVLCQTGFDNPIGFFYLAFLFTPVIYLITIEQADRINEKRFKYNKVHCPLKNCSSYQRFVWDMLYRYYSTGDIIKEQKFLEELKQEANSKYEKLIAKKQERIDFMGNVYSSENWYAKMLQEEYDKLKRTCLELHIVDEKDRFVGVWNSIPDWHVTPEERLKLFGENK